MKKILYGILVFLFLAVVAALVAPGLIDWNRYKDKIIAHVSQELGRQLSVDGDISLAILPVPAFSVTGIRIAGLDGSGAPEMLRLKSLDVQVALFPLLVGSVEVARIVLVEPDITLERLTDGRRNWVFPNINFGTDEGKTTSSLPLISIEELRIQNGILTYSDSVKGLTERFEKINVTLSVPSLAGPFEISGHVQFKNIDLEIETGIVELVTDRRIAVKGTALSDGLSVRFAATSDIDRVPFIDGRLNIEGEDLESVLIFTEWFAGKPFPDSVVTAQKVRLSSDFAYHDETLEVDSLSIRLGDISGTGSGKVSLSAPVNFDMAFQFARLNLDNFPYDLLSANLYSVRDRETADKSSSEQFNISGFSIPESLMGNLDITADAVLYRSQAVRDVKISLGVANQVVNMKEISALFPGGSDVTFFGSLGSSDGVPHFVGQISAGSDNLRALLEWMEFDTDGIPADRLRRINLSALIDGTLTSGTVTEIDLLFDASHLTGGIAYAISGSRPGFGIGIQVDQLNLDAYFPQFVVESQPSGDKSSAPSESRDTRRFSKEAMFQFLGGFDADFDIRLNNLTVHKTPVRDLVLDGLLQQNTLNVRQVNIGDLSGSTVNLSGLVTGLGAIPVVEGTINFRTEKLATLARVIPLLHDLPPALLGPLSIDAMMHGSMEHLELEGTIAALNSELQLKGVFTDPLKIMGFNVAAQIQSPSLEDLVKAFTNGNFVGGPNDLLLNSPISISFDADGDISEFQLETTARFADGEIEVAGSISKLFEVPEVKLRGTLSYPSLHSLIGILGRKINQPVPLLSHPIDLEFLVDGTLAEPDLEGLLTLGELTLDFYGRTKGFPVPEFFESEIDIKHPDFTALLASLGKYEAVLNEKNPLKVEVKVIGTEGLLMAPHLNITVADASVIGSAEIDRSGVRPKLTADLIADHVTLEHFLAPAGVYASEKKSSGDLSSPIAAAMKSDDKIARWSPDAIDFTSLGVLDANIQLRSESVDISSIEFGDVRLVLSLDDSYLTIEQLVGRVFDGDLELFGTINGRATPIVELNVKLSGGDIRQVLSKFAEVDGLTGKTDISFEVSARGRSQQELVASLNGVGSVENVGDGTIEGINLRALSDQIDNLDSVGDFIDLARVSFEGGYSPYTELGGNFLVTNGEWQTDNLRLVADGGVGDVSGVVDLVGWTQDLVFTFRLTDHPDLPPIALKLSGPLDEPSQSMQTSEIEEFLLTRGLRAAIQETVAGKVGDLGAAAEVIEDFIREGDSPASSDEIRGVADALIDQLIGTNGVEADETGPIAEGEPVPVPAPAGKEPEDPFIDLLQRLLRE